MAASEACERQRRKKKKGDGAGGYAWVGGERKK